jgi:hypothetical protein
MDYSVIKAKCQKISDFSEPVLNELMYYAAQKNKLDQRFDQLAKKHKRVFDRLDPSNQRLFKSQFIVHEIFKRGGLIHKYLNHTQIKRLPQDVYDYLQKQAAVPWRFAYWYIRSSPSPDFFEAVDVFTGEEFLLFSLGVSRTLMDSNIATFGGLISSNGSCYQTFGPLIGFMSFNADDIFFYAGELDPSLESIDDLTVLVEKDLFSFILLFAFSAIPMVQHKGDEILSVNSVIEFSDFEVDLWQKDFRVENSKGVFKMSRREIETFPHFGCVYWDEHEEELMVSALTDIGYFTLVKCLAKLGIAVPLEPDIRLHLSMKTAINDILGYKVDLVPYEEIFQNRSYQNDTSPEMNTLNGFLILLMSAVNSNKEVDIDRIISETGADPQVAKAVYEDLIKKFERGK